MRDTQRSKVYAAERIIEAAGGTMTITECQTLVDQVLRSPFIARRFPERIDRLRRYGITVTTGRGGGRAWSSPANPYRNDYGRALDWERDRRSDNLPTTTYVITLGTWARQPVVVLHEVAHHLAGCNHHHDHVFTSTLLVLIRQFIGAAEADVLKASYKEHRVRTRPKVTRTMTDGQRAAAAARLSAARSGPTERSTVATFDHDEKTHTCGHCAQCLPVTKFPTTRTPGVREARCRRCRDAR